MNTCESCDYIVQKLICENKNEYSKLRNIYNNVINEKNLIKNYSYLLMNILFFLINNYIGIINCEKYFIDKEIIQENIDRINLLIESLHFKSLI